MGRRLTLRARGTLPIAIAAAATAPPPSSSSAALAVGVSRTGLARFAGVTFGSLVVTFAALRGGVGSGLRRRFADAGTVAGELGVAISSAATTATATATPTATAFAFLTLFATLVALFITIPTSLRGGRRWRRRRWRRRVPRLHHVDLLAGELAHVRLHFDVVLGKLREQFLRGDAEFLRQREDRGGFRRRRRRRRRNGFDDRRAAFVSADFHLLAIAAATAATTAAAAASAFALLVVVLRTSGPLGAGRLAGLRLLLLATGLDAALATLFLDRLGDRRLVLVGLAVGQVVERAREDHRGGVGGRRLAATTATATTAATLLLTIVLFELLAIDRWGAVGERR